MKMTALLASAAAFLSATAAHAQIKAPSVPEIDALSGFAAIAIVGAGVALIRERSKRS